MNRLTIRELINELKQFNPDAYIIFDNFEDNVELDLSWAKYMEGEITEPRDIEKEKKEATHVTINFIVNGKSCFQEFSEH